MPKTDLTLNQISDLLDKKLKPVNSRLDNIEQRLDTHTSSLVKIEATLEGYRDMYKVNKEKTKELKERVDMIEDQLGISKDN